MDKNKATRDTRYLTLLSVLSCVAVVFLHTNGVFWHFSATRSYWKTSVVIESVFYFAVPVFYMISGATLMDYADRYSTGVFINKRIQKTLIPFIAWSLIGLLFAHFVLETIDLAAFSFLDIFNSVMNTSVVTIFWFFPVIFRGYLCIPLLGAVEKNRRKEVFVLLAAGGYCLNVLIPFLKEMYCPELVFSVNIDVVSSTALFFIIGYLLDRYDCTKWTRCAIYAAAAVALLVHIIGTYVESMQAGAVVNIYKNPVISIPYACGVFVLVRSLGGRIMDSFLGKVVMWLKDYTLAIYLLHWFVMKWFNQLFSPDLTWIVYRLGMPFILIPVCIAITAVVRKIPVLRHILPK